VAVFAVWLLLGGFIGWVASSPKATREGLLLNIGVGIAGAFLAGMVLTPLVGIGTINQDDFSLPALMVSLVGSILLLAVVCLFRRQRVIRLMEPRRAALPGKSDRLVGLLQQKYGYTKEHAEEEFIRLLRDYPGPH